MSIRLSALSHELPASRLVADGRPLTASFVFGPPPPSSVGNHPSSQLAVLLHVFGEFPAEDFWRKPSFRAFLNRNIHRSKQLHPGSSAAKNPQESALLPATRCTFPTAKAAERRKRDFRECNWTARQPIKTRLATCCADPVPKGRRRSFPKNASTRTGHLFLTFPQLGVTIQLV